MRRISVFVKDNYLSPVIHESDPPYPLSVRNGVLEINLNDGDTAYYPVNALWCWTDEYVKPEPARIDAAPFLRSVD
jgi:hypothetical protein